MAVAASISAAASDFSPMGNPAFSRSMFMPVKERRMIRCVRRWTYSGERDALAPLVSEIERRIGIRLGDPAQARLELAFDRRTTIDELMKQSAPLKIDQMRDGSVDLIDEAASENALPMPAECAALSGAFASGGLDAAIAMLGPAPQQAVPLPAAGSCLALLKRAGQADGQDAARLMALIRNAPDDRISAAEKAQVWRDYAAFSDATELTVGDPPRAIAGAKGEMRDFIMIPCFGSIMELVRRAGFEDAALPVPQARALNLFGRDGLLDDLDADLADHPEWLGDPERITALGLFGG